MSLEFEYWCDQACSYIRFKPDREKVRQELLAHLEDKREELMQQEELLKTGKTLSEIDRAVLEAMGDAAETGRALAKVHSPWLGWLWQASRIVLVVAVILLVFTSFGFMKRSGLFDNRDSDFYRQSYEQVFNENRTKYGERIFLLQPDVFAKCDGYTIKVTRVAKWHYDFVDETGERHVSDKLYFTLETFNPLPWADYPEGIFYLTAVDSAGNIYTNCYARGERAVVGNLKSRGMFSCCFEMWVEGLYPDAHWLKLQYDRSGRFFSLLIPLTGGKNQ